MTFASYIAFAAIGLSALAIGLALAERNRHTEFTPKTRAQADKIVGIFLVLFGMAFVMIFVSLLITAFSQLAAIWTF